MAMVLAGVAGPVGGDAADEMRILANRFIYQGLRHARSRRGGLIHDIRQAIPATVGPFTGVAARLGRGS
jgi:hypothetical protein